MANMQSDPEFFAHISNEARVPEDDARSLVEDFLRAISGFIDETAANVLEEIAPSGLTVGKTELSIRNDASVEEFLLEMSDEESVATGRAAEHARVVAEAMSERADEASLEHLVESIANQDILALFETHRGELTELEQPTAGEKAQSGE